MREFWNIPLRSLGPEEWEALCDGCAKCCHDDTLFGRSVKPCSLLDTKTNRCSDYEHRLERKPGYCSRITPGAISTGRLPESCSYVRRSKGLPLESWQIETAKTNYSEGP